MKRVRRWRVPPKWCLRDWLEEARGDGALAGCEAIRDFDPSRGVPLHAFVEKRVLAAILTRYRREWSYGGRCGDSKVAEQGNEEWGDDLRTRETNASVEHLLDKLSPSESSLMRNVFWEGRSETQMAQELGISHQAVNRRRQAVLGKLRTRLGSRELAAAN